MRPPRRFYGWTLMWTLACTVTVAYGVIYAFGVTLRPMEGDLGLTRAQTSLPLTLAYLVSGLAAPLIGRLVDRRGARGVLTLGSALFALMVLLQAHATTLTHLLLIGAGLGLAMACVLYDVVFTVVAVWFSAQRARATLLVTLVGALASAVFIPLSTWLEAHLGWRGTLEVLAALVLTTCVLAHLGLHPDGPPAPPAQSVPTPIPASSRAVLGTRVFWSVAGAFLLAKLAAGVLGLHLVPLLTERGLPAAFVAGVAGAVGLVQLLGRVFFTPLVGGRRLADLTALLFLVHAAGIAALAWWPSELGALVFVLLYGTSNGAMTLARALLVGELFGAERYGQVNGWMTLLVALGLAAAPWFAGVGHALTGSYSLVLVALLLALVTAAGLIQWGQQPG